jgi:hypothetical protein
MIPEFAEQVEEYRNVLLNEVEQSHDYWDDPNSDRFNRYFNDSNYKYNIDTFVDQLKLTLSVFEKVESEMRELESECGGSSSSGGGWFSSFQASVPYNIADSQNKQLKANKKLSKEQQFKDATDKLKKKIEEKRKQKEQIIKVNNGEYDIFVKNGKPVAATPNAELGARERGMSFDEQAEIKEREKINAAFEKRQKEEELAQIRKKMFDKINGK